MNAMKNQVILTPYFLDHPLPGLDHLVQADWEVVDPLLPEGEPQARMSVLYDHLAGFITAAIQQGNRPVSLAGDCCTSLGVLAGLQRAGIDPVLIWFDAHGDFNTWETTPSGFLGGMPLAMLVGRGEQTILDALAITPLPEEQVILSDARDLDPGEREAVGNSRVTRLRTVTELLGFALPRRPLWVHFDTDVVDAGESPGMSYPVPGGPSVENVRQVFHRLAKTGQVVAVSLSAWSPSLDREKKSEEVSLSLLADLIA